MKKCKICGKPVQNERYDTCIECHRKRRPAPPAVLPNDYLVHGYFDEKGYLFIDLISNTAEQVAWTLGNSFPSLTNSQLRRFFSHARAAQNSLNMIGNYDQVRADIHKLRSFAAEAASESKKKVPKTFYEFIAQNLDLVTDEKSFSKGFMEHFQAVVAFFYYHFPRK